MPFPSARARIAALLLHALIVIALPVSGGVLGALAAVPLLAPVRGLWRGRPYTYAWASLLVVFYAGAFLMEAYTHHARSGAALGLAALAAAEFCALLLFVRLRAVEARRAKQ